MSEAKMVKGEEGRRLDAHSKMGVLNLHIKKINLQTVPQSIIMVGKMYLKPYRFVRNWTGNSAAKKHSS